MRRRVINQLPEATTPVEAISTRVARVEFHSPSRALITVTKHSEVKKGALVRVAKDADSELMASINAAEPAMVTQVSQNDSAAFRGDINVAVVDLWQAVDECVKASRYVDKDELGRLCVHTLEEAGA
jgi:ubiquinone biosynthesis protein UbiJ